MEHGVNYRRLIPLKKHSKIDNKMSDRTSYCRGSFRPDRDPPTDFDGFSGFGAFAEPTKEVLQTPWVPRL